jgi:multiple antibiotic resistance protein
MDVFLESYVGLFLSAFVSLFVVVDPLGTSAVFISLTKKHSAEEKKAIAGKAVLTALILLICFCLVGHWILNYMSVSLDAFRVAGGLLLFVTAFRMIMGFHDPDQLESGSAYKDLSDIAVFPLSIPLLAGPGVMTAALMFTTAVNDVIGYLVILSTIFLVQGISLMCLLGSTQVSAFFGKTVNSIIARVMGILLAAMAVQFVADGIKVLAGF